MKKRRFANHTKRLIVVAGLFLGISGSSFGQISHKAVDRHEQLKKKSLREASQMEVSAYKDTHLNMDAYSFKKGGVGKQEGRALGQMFRPGGASDKESVQRTAGTREKKFRLFRKKLK